ncbi:hypothetical protein [Sphingobium xenophagum]|uniref:hypothetical protein n=1 Tax=Sphingobium xenophagum TaxID=121428 RepID=UPI0012FC4592|nr:hypothetical protein [Sphingobium xenophagum]
MRLETLLFAPALIFSGSAFGQTGKLIGLDQGKYVGTYQCAQGLTELELYIQSDGQNGRSEGATVGKFVRLGEFKFKYRMLRNIFGWGRYHVRIQEYPDGRVVMTPDPDKERLNSMPQGFRPVGAVLRRDGSAGFFGMQGKISDPQCGAISMRKWESNVHLDSRTMKGAVGAVTDAYMRKEEAERAYRDRGCREVITYADKNGDVDTKTVCQR